MTTQREPIHLAIESAPRDRFDDDGPRVFRVVAFCGTGATRRHKVALTRDHEAESDAMSVFADKVLRAANEAAQVALLVEVNVLQGRIAALEAKGKKR